VPSTYSSGGKTYHGKIIKQGNKWLRWAFVEAVAPAIARKLLTIAFQILRDQRAYEPRGITTTEGASTISRLS